MARQYYRETPPTNRLGKGCVSLLSADEREIVKRGVGGLCGNIPKNIRRNLTERGIIARTRKGDGYCATDLGRFLLGDGENLPSCYHRTADELKSSIAYFMDEAEIAADFEIDWMAKHWRALARFYRVILQAKLQASE